MAEAPWSVFTHGQLHDGARLLVAYLWRSTNHGDGEPFAWPSAVHLAKELGTDERTIRRRLEAAQQEGFIIRDRRRANGSRRWGWLLVDPVADRSSAAPDTGSPDPGAGVRRGGEIRTPTTEPDTGGKPDTTDARSGHPCPPDAGIPDTGVRRSLTAKHVEALPPIAPHPSDGTDLPPTLAELQAMQDPTLFELESPAPPEHDLAAQVLRLMCDAVRDLTGKPGGPQDRKTNRDMIAEATKREGATLEDWRRVISAQLESVRPKPSAWHYLALSTITRPKNWARLADAPRGRRESRGPVDPQTQDHDMEIPF